MTRVTLNTAGAALACVFASAAMLVAQTSGQSAPPQTSKPVASPAPQAPPKPALQFPANAKIAFVVMQQVVNDSKIGKCGLDRLRTKQDADQKAQQDKAKELQAQQAKMQSQSSLVNEATATQYQRDYERMQREMQSLAQSNQTDEQNLNSDLLLEFGNAVQPVVEALRNEKGLWIIFAAGPDSNLAAYDPALDLSEELTKRLDAAHPDPCPKKAPDLR